MKWKIDGIIEGRGSCGAMMRNLSQISGREWGEDQCKK